MDDECTCEAADGYDEGHPCPYKIEMGDDYETTCHCCASCEGECAMNV